MSADPHGPGGRDAGAARAASTPRAPSTTRTPRVLSIAGSDSGGGAGIQADLKAFAYCGVHGMSAVTALTAQNTVAVTAVHPVPPEMIVAQIRAVLEDIGVDAVKIGMLGTAPAAHAVAGVLGELAPATPVVLDPVMVSESGARLLEQDAQRALVEDLLPRATVVTPNLAEARVLAGLAAEDQSPPEDRTPPEELARRVHALGPRYVVVTGGHREQATDVFFDGEQIVELAGPRHPDGAAHGSGCTHSSALAAQLALGLEPLAAARVARGIAAQAVAAGLRDVGRGVGPVDVLGLAERR